MSGNYPAPTETDPVRLCRSIRDLFEGRSNAMGTFDLVTDVGTTTVTAPNCGAQSRILLMPRSANAATEWAAGTIYVSDIAQGQFTVTHVNSATASRTFDYAIVG